MTIAKLRTSKQLWIYSTWGYLKAWGALLMVRKKEGKKQEQRFGLDSKELWWLFNDGYTVVGQQGE